MCKKILILSDSLPLAREKPEKTEFGETWPQILKKEGFEIYQVSIGGATSTDLLKQAHYHLSFNPDIVLIQVGIVDCAPRFATKFEIEFLTRIPFGKIILRKINSPKIRNKRKISYVHVHTFARNLKKIEAIFSGQVFFLTILPSNLQYEKTLPGISEQIEKFNKVIYTHKNIIDLSRITSDGIMSDFHHLNKEGHSFVAREIIKKLK